MKCRVVFFSLTVAVLFLPTVQAAHTDVRQYDVFVDVIRTSTAGSSNPGATPETQVVVAEWHDLPVLARQTSVELNLHYVVNEMSLGTEESTYRLFWDSQSVADCVWTVAADGMAVVGTTVRCELGDVAPGDYSYEIRRIATTGQPILDATKAIRITQLEQVEENMQLDVTAVWPILWIFSVFLTMRIRQPWLRLLAAMLGLGWLSLTLEPLWFGILAIAQTGFVLIIVYQMMEGRND